MCFLDAEREAALGCRVHPAGNLVDFRLDPQVKPEQAEIARLKREVTKLKAERDILKKAAAYFAKESL